MSSSPSSSSDDAWSSFSSCRAQLLSETALVGALIYKNHNQQRRTRYWQALRRAHREVLRLSSAVASHEAPDFARPSAALRDTAARCTACAAAVTMHARALTARQTGAGFAALMAVLMGSVAQYVYLALRMRDACRAVGGARGEGRAAAVDRRASAVRGGDGEG